MQSYSISAILLAGVLFSTAHLAVGIKCFVCNTVEDQKCSSDNVRELPLTSCPPKDTRCFSYRQEGSFYTHENSTYKYGVRVLRGCSAETRVGSDTCISRAGQTQSMKVKYCSCAKDECNSVLHTLKASLPLILALHLFLYMSGRY